jgi:hypothetical protein
MQDYSEDRQDKHRATAFTTTIPRAAVAAVDALHRKIILSGARVVALSAPHHDAATIEVGRMLCQSFAASGSKTLLVDATAELRDDDELDAWVPGEPIRDGQIEGPSTAHPTDLLRIRATPRTRAMFNNPGRLQKSLRDDLAHYGSIIMTLPPILEIGEHHTNSVSLARAADATILVCTGEQTTLTEAREAVAALKDADVDLAGVILDNSNVTPPGPEMAAFVEKYFPLPGGMRRRLADFLRSSEYFNDRARALVRENG